MGGNWSAAPCLSALSLSLLLLRRPSVSQSVSQPPWHFYPATHLHRYLASITTVVVVMPFSSFDYAFSLPLSFFLALPIAPLPASLSTTILGLKPPSPLLSSPSRW